MKTLKWIDTAVCLGNGQSRQGLNLNKLKQYLFQYSNYFRLYTAKGSECLEENYEHNKRTF